MKLFFIISTLIVFFVSCSQQKEVILTPDKALKKFYLSENSEEQLMDPLILEGSSIVPLVLIDIENVNMINRRYAIEALGHIGDSRALIPLEKILTDNKEQDYFKCDALKAIGMINFNRAKELSLFYKNTPIDCLKEYSANILANQYQVWLSNNHIRRTIEDINRSELDSLLTFSF